MVPCATYSGGCLFFAMPVPPNRCVRSPFRRAASVLCRRRAGRRAIGLLQARAWPMPIRRHRPRQSPVPRGAAGPQRAASLRYRHRGAMILRRRQRGNPPRPATLRRVQTWEARGRPRRGTSSYLNTSDDVRKTRNETGSLRVLIGQTDGPFGGMPVLSTVVIFEPRMEHDRRRRFRHPRDEGVFRRGPRRDKEI